MKILAIIIQRISSERLVRKNLLPFAGKTLLEWALIRATTTQQIDDTILVTDSQEMAAVASGYGVEVMIQPRDAPGFGLDAFGTRCQLPTVLYYRNSHIMIPAYIQILDAIVFPGHANHGCRVFLFVHIDHAVIVARLH